VGSEKLGASYDIASERERGGGCGGPAMGYGVDCGNNSPFSNQAMAEQMSENQTSEAESGARWQPLERIDRRVVGVMVEKAKTTPENYPLSSNALVNGCNQKSNRFPQMQLDEGQVDDAIERLRAVGAAAVIQGDGRVDKYRHLLYDWLGVDKVELAVMAELLLRGAQTLGELRGRAARMEPIKGISELRPIVDSLQQKGLVIFLTPPGRGCVVTHALYQEQELEKVRAEHGNLKVDAPPTPPPASAASAAPQSAPTPAPLSVTGVCETDALQALRNEVVALKEQFTEFREQIQSETDELRRDLDELNRQLGV